jgi:hypothetical protein
MLLGSYRLSGPGLYITVLTLCRYYMTWVPRLTKLEQNCNSYNQFTPLFVCVCSPSSLSIVYLNQCNFSGAEGLTLASTFICLFFTFFYIFLYHFFVIPHIHLLLVKVRLAYIVLVYAATMPLYV